MNLPVVNNLDNKFNMRQSDILNTRFSKSVNNREHMHNLLLKQKSGNILYFHKFEAISGNRFWFNQMVKGLTKQNNGSLGTKTPENYWSVFVGSK